MRRRFSLKSLLVLTAICALACGIYKWVSAKDALLTDGYHQYLTGIVVVDFMKHNNGAWPRNWDALKGHFEPFCNTKRGVTFETYKARIFIDFKVDVEELHRLALSSDRPTFKVIYARYTTGFYSLGDANLMICDYLRQRWVNTPDSSTDEASK